MITCNFYKIDNSMSIHCTENPPYSTCVYCLYLRSSDSCYASGARNDIV